MVLLLVLIGCQGRQQELRPPDALEMERCVAALRAGPLPEEGQERPIVACAGPLARAYPRCAEAIRAAAHRPPAEQTTSMLAACRDAYCPTLPDPRPTLCDEPMAPPGAPQLAQASELFEAMAQVEGHVGLQGGLSPEVWAELSRPPPRPEPAVEQGAGPTLVVAALPGGARLSSSEVSVDLLDGAAADAALAELLGPGDGRRLNLRVDRDVSFQMVLGVQRAALDAGFASYTVTTFSLQSDDVPVP